MKITYAAALFVCILSSSSTKADWPALFVAVSASNFGDVKALPARGANINARLPDGSTPLHISVVWSMPEMVKGLSNYPGIALDVKDNHGDTPIVLAVRHVTELNRNRVDCSTTDNESIVVVRILRAAGAKIEEARDEANILVATTTR